MAARYAGSAGEWIEQHQRLMCDRSQKPIRRRPKSRRCRRRWRAFNLNLNKCNKCGIIKADRRSYRKRPLAATERRIRSVWKLCRISAWPLPSFEYGRTSSPQRTRSLWLGLASFYFATQRKEDVLLKLSQRETCTLLAALLYWQEETVPHGRHVMCPTFDSSAFHTSCLSIGVNSHALAIDCRNSLSSPR